MVALDTTMEGRDGDNCHLYKCNPPESCEWTTEEGYQSVLLVRPTTTPKTNTHTANATSPTFNSFNVTDSANTTFNSDSIITGFDSDVGGTTPGTERDITGTTMTPLVGDIIETQTEESPEEMVTTESFLTNASKKAGISTKEPRITTRFDEDFEDFTTTGKQYSSIIMLP